MKTKLILVLMSLATSIFAQELPKLETFTLKNGLKVYVMKYGKMEAMNVRLLVNSGRKNETPGQQGYGELTAGLLLEGNDRYTKEEQNDRAFRLGANLNVDVNNDYTFIGGDFLAKNADEAIDLMSAAILQPKFDKDIIERFKNYIVDNNQVNKMDIANLADIFSDYFIFGIDHPLGRHYYKTQVLDITPEKIRTYYSFNYTPKNVRLVITGNIEVATIKAIVEKYFGNWQSALGEVNGVVLDKPQIKKKEMAFINRANATQCALQWNKIGPSLNDKDALAFDIANRLLNEVLFTEIREKGGKTYGIRASLANSKYADILAITCSVRSNELFNTIQLVDKTLLDFYNTPILADKCNESINELKIRLMSTENPSEISARYDPIKYDFEKRKNLMAELLALKVEDVQKAVKKYLTPDSYKLVIAGDEALVKEQLARLKNLVTFKPTDIERNGN